MLSEMVGRWQRDGLVTADRDPRAVARLFLTEALGLCTTAAFRPDPLASERFVELFHRQLRLLLGEKDS